VRSQWRANSLTASEARCPTIKTCGIVCQFGRGPVELRRLRQLEEENGQLKRIVADLTLDKQMLQDVLKKGSEGAAAPATREHATGGLSGLGATCLCDGAIAAQRLSLRGPTA